MYFKIKLAIAQYMILDEFSDMKFQSIFYTGCSYCVNNLRPFELCNITASFMSNRAPDNPEWEKSSWQQTLDSMSSDLTLSPHENLEVEHDILANNIWNI